MKLTESQLIEMIRESAMKVINEIGYHEKQKREVSDKEHTEWVKKKSEAKKRELERQRKENGDDKSDSKAIDYHDYKHGKGNFPVMKEETEVVRFTESQFNNFITEAVRRVIKETTLDYDMDNFSGRWRRGPRYDILVDGEVYYSDVPDESVDRLCADLERQGYENIQAQEL